MGIIPAILTIGALSALTYLLKWAGTEFALGTMFGLVLNYVLYQNWRIDAQRERGATDQPK